VVRGRSGGRGRGLTFIEEHVMAFPIGKILMAYRPLYLRGLLMDGQYRLPAGTPEPVQGSKVKISKQVPAQRTPATPATLRGARA
jgi:hypothetical protein